MAKTASLLIIARGKYSWSWVARHYTLPDWWNWRRIGIASIDTFTFECLPALSLLQMPSLVLSEAYEWWRNIVGTVVQVRHLRILVGRLGNLCNHHTWLWRANGDHSFQSLLALYATGGIYTLGSGPESCVASQHTDGHIEGLPHSAWRAGEERAATWQSLLMTWKQWSPQ